MKAVFPWGVQLGEIFIQIIRKFAIFSIAILFFALAAHAENETNAEAEKLNDDIINAFSTNRCEGVSSFAVEGKEGILDALTLGVLGYCQNEVPKGLHYFFLSEAKRPDYDLVLALKGRFMWKRDLEASKKIWERLYQVAQNEAMRDMASDYLAGRITDNDERALLATDKWSYYISAQTGVSRENNPYAYSGGNLREETSSNAINSAAILNFGRETDFGSINADYSFSHVSYFSAHGADFQDHYFEAPLTIRVGASQDLSFKPFFDYVFVGDQPYQSYVGGALRGSLYQDKMTHYIQASFVSDWYYPSASKPEAGIHFRFDYNWSYFQFPFSVQTNFAMEHVQAGADQPDDDALSVIHYSHSDLSLQAVTSYMIWRLIPGFATALYFRNDSQESRFISPVRLISVSKQRQDFTAEIKPTLTIPIWTHFQIYLWYSYLWATSNLGPDDYVDRNYRNQTVGLAVRVFDGR